MVGASVLFHGLHQASLNQSLVIPAALSLHEPRESDDIRWSVHSLLSATCVACYGTPWFEGFANDCPVAFDIGTNIGADAEFLLEQGFCVVALDANPMMIARARWRLARFGPRVHYVSMGLDEHVGRSTFYITQSVVHSSFSLRKATQYKQQISPTQVRTIRCEALWALTENAPHFVKIDIEERNYLCIDAITSLPRERLPRYVAWEMHEYAKGLDFPILDLELIGKLQARGYDKMKIAGNKARGPTAAFDSGGRLPDDVIDVETSQTDWVSTSLKLAAGIPCARCQDGDWWDYYMKLGETACYESLPHVALDYGQHLGDMAYVSDSACEEACASNADCNSVVICPRSYSKCFLKQKVVSSVNEQRISGDCRTHYKTPCTQASPLSTSTCDNTRWPGMKARCSDNTCKALIFVDAYGGSCTAYCQAAAGTDCVSVEEDIGDSCTRINADESAQMSCSTDVRKYGSGSDVLCICAAPQATTWAPAGYAFVGNDSICRGIGWNRNGWPRHVEGIFSIVTCAAACSEDAECTGFDLNEENCWKFGHVDVTGETYLGARCYKKIVG